MDPREQPSDPSDNEEEILSTRAQRRYGSVQRLFPIYQPRPLQTAPPPPSFRPYRPPPPSPSHPTSRPTVRPPTPTPPRSTVSPQPFRQPPQRQPRAPSPPPPSPRPLFRPPSSPRPSPLRPTQQPPSRPPSSPHPPPPTRPSPLRKSTPVRPSASSSSSQPREASPPLSPHSGKPLDPLFPTQHPVPPLFSFPRYLALPAPVIVPDPVPVPPRPTLPPKSPSPPHPVPPVIPVEESMPIPASTDATVNHPAAPAAGDPEINQPAAPPAAAGSEIEHTETTLPPHSTPPASPTADLAPTSSLSPTENDSTSSEHPAAHTPTSTSSYIPSETTTPTSSSVPSAHTSSSEHVARVSTLHQPAAPPAVAGTHQTSPGRDTDMDFIPLSPDNSKGKRKALSEPSSEPSATQQPKRTKSAAAGSSSGTPASSGHSSDAIVATLESLTPPPSAQSASRAATKYARAFFLERYPLERTSASFWRYENLSTRPVVGTRYLCTSVLKTLRVFDDVKQLLDTLGIFWLVTETRQTYPTLCYEFLSSLCRDTSFDIITFKLGGATRQLTMAEICAIFSLTPGLVRSRIVTTSSFSESK